jgi:hypothetical protein
MRILSWPTDRILKEVDQLDKDSKQIKSDLAKICWYMRGSISYEEAHFLSYEEKEIISKLIKENMDTTKKSGLPFF